tara:strand:- start:558 stop:1307 length:750 start_codon:yes stop_codon:yes gene_type:complete
MTSPGDRVVRQFLENLGRAGITHLGVGPSDTREDSSEDQDVMDQPPVSSLERKTGEMTRTQDASSTPGGSLDQIAAQVAACQRCQELAGTRTQTVFGVGDPQARVLFIGEAPGADEDRLGEPFVGRAGKLLDKIIEAMGMRREEIYICNILKCRPPGNRNPSPEEAGNCREFLDAQLALVQPEYIVCWGSVAAKNLLDSTETIGRMRKQFFEYAGARVLCTYHPSYLLRNPSAKKDVWEDMQLLLAELG